MIGLYGDNGKENGNYYNGVDLDRDYIGMMEKKLLAMKSWKDCRF